jgi:hypothetical protein
MGDGWAVQVKNGKFSDDDLAKLTNRIQFGGDEVRYSLTRS